MAKKTGASDQYDQNGKINVENEEPDLIGRKEDVNADFKIPTDRFARDEYIR